MGWAEAQRNEAFRDVLRGFYSGFLHELRRVAESWQRSGAVADTASADDVAKAVMSFLLGFVAQSAILGDVAPDALTRGLRGLSGGGGDHPAPGIPEEGGVGDGTRSRRSARPRNR